MSLGSSASDSDENETTLPLSLMPVGVPPRAMPSGSWLTSVVVSVWTSYTYESTSLLVSAAPMLVAFVA